MASKSNDTESDHNIMQEDILAAPVSVDWQRGESVGACLLEMYERGLWTDVRFRCKDEEDGKSIKAHKIVLAARSPVFQAMFFGPCADGKDEVELKDTEKEIFLLLLRYIYSDTVKLNEDTAWAVLEMAHCYQISSLVQFCADYLATVISPANTCRILTSAIIYELTSLSDECCSFIDSHAEEILKSEGFLDLPEECLIYILKGDTFYAKEGEILEAAERWAKKKLSERGEEESGANIRRVLGRSFYQLRLPTMTNKSLLEHVSRKGYFSIEEYADMAGFINKVSDIEISTNSCVARRPSVETIQVNDECGDEVIKNSITTSFEISVSQDVALASIAIGKIKPYLWNTKNLYSDQFCREYFSGQVGNDQKYGVNFPFEGYDNKIIKLRSSERNGKREFYVTILNQLEDAFESNLGFSLSGNIRIRCLDFNQSFTLQQHQNNNGKVNLTPPLLLKRSNGPYIVQMDMKYDCGYQVQMKTRCSNSRKIISNGTVTIKEVGYYGVQLAGIKSIGIHNFSNRDNGEEASQTKGENC